MYHPLKGVFKPSGRKKLGEMMCAVKGTAVLAPGGTLLLLAAGLLMVGS
jgi:hypothetical protein